ncbi:MAG: helix-turn-helix domain-containing protein [Actinobacteria bacterium]|nr:MAG: helix-turn-helix domain-containing protein [Actinomycetota bacterium]
MLVFMKTDMWSRQLVTESVTSLIQEQLSLREWAQADLARVLGWSVQALSDVMQGKRRLDAAMALDLSATLRIDAEEILAVQAAAELDAARRSGDAESRLETIGKRAELEAVVPVRELVKRKAIAATDPDRQLSDVKALLEVDDLRDVPPYMVSAKRMRSGVPLTRAQTAWVALARQRAREIDAQPYDEVEFRQLSEALAHEVREPTDFEGLPDRFAATGVRLIHIPAFPGGRIDGVSMRLECAPMIALSGRGKRIDRVLFALLHECAHVVSGHWRDGVVQVHEDGIVGDAQMEEEVNQMAQTWILPEGLERPGSLNSAGVHEMAQRNNVSPALIIGQLQHSGVIPWASVLSRGLPNVEEPLLAWH